MNDADVIKVRAGYMRDEKLNVEAIVFLSDDGESFEVQRQLVPDGSASYEIGSNMTGSVDDAVASWTVNGSRLRFELYEAAAEEVRLDRRIDLEVDDVTALAEVLPHLKRILDT